VVRGALVASVLGALAGGCGGGSPEPPERTPGPGPPERRIATGELRSPDARSPFVPAGDGAWRCPTAARIQLALSPDGEVSVSTPGMVLTSVAPTRALVNRACDPVRLVAAPRTAGWARRGRVGATLVRCDAPRAVLVDFADGDVTLRAPDGRFLAAAAIGPSSPGVAGYWGSGCALPD
jgi:hypothetical protein